MLLTTLALNKNGYDLKGIYSLEEYYAKDLQGYYEAITIGDSHNYYLGRAEVDITNWVNIGFLISIGEGKQRKYQLNEKYEKIL